MDIAEVVLRLTGPVEPVGDSRMDEHRLENLRTLCDVAGVLLDRIELVAEVYGDHMASIKAAKDHAAEFLRARGVEGRPYNLPAEARERLSGGHIAKPDEHGVGGTDGR